eukprot:TRINITY_DN1416_c0_g1_i2.p1 TRINITY_DN1416_c0_g1~~TRINITY_DN1416_c0_g1_i2.p1  ORF type:complete len:258 (-),score=14.86 TRINITY_DN1416_c0_g1_i2:2-661(-)
MSAKCSRYKCSDVADKLGLGQESCGRHFLKDPTNKETPVLLFMMCLERFWTPSANGDGGTLHCPKDGQLERDSRTKHTFPLYIVEESNEVECSFSGMYRITRASYGTVELGRVSLKDPMCVFMKNPKLSAEGWFKTQQEKSALACGRPWPPIVLKTAAEKRAEAAAERKLAKGSVPRVKKIKVAKVPRVTWKSRGAPGCGKCRYGGCGTCFARARKMKI